MPFIHPRYTFAVLLSLLLAIAFATLSVAAPNADAKRAELQDLVDELVKHIEFVRQTDHRLADARLKQLAETLKYWKQSGKTDVDAIGMHQWLNESIQKSLAGSRALLAATPRFSEPVVVQVIPTPEPTPEVITEFKPEVIPETAVADASTPKPTATVDNMDKEEPPRETFAQEDQSQPQDTLPWLRSEVADSTLPEPKPTTVNKPEPKEKPTVVALKEELTPGKEIGLTPPKEIIDDPEPPKAETKKTASVWQRHPAAKAIDLSNPFGDEGNSSTGRRVAMRPAAMKVTNRTRVEVNNLELGARVRGYVHGLRGVEARLLADPQMSAEELLSLVRELRQLGNQRDMLSLYMETESMPGSKGKQLPTLTTAKRMVDQQLSELKRADKSDTRVLETTSTMLLAL